MRFNTTIEHSRVRREWEEAYAAADAFAEAGDDGVKMGGTEASDKAWEVESHALRAMMLFPATTPAEMQDKIAFMRKRGPLSQENLCWNEDDMQAALDTIEIGLMRMTRPNVSKPVAEAFDKWALAHALYWSRGDWPDEDSSRLCDAEDEAEKALHEVPCTTPGDFIAKAYVELMGEYGAEGYTSAGLAFLVQEAAISHHADKAKLRDILDSDLGCCMAALGKVDFDAGEYLVQCRRFGKRVAVTRSSQDGEPTRGLSLGMDHDHTAMAGLLDRLPANGLRMVSAERCQDIADEIEANWPELIYGSYAVEAPQPETAE